MKYEIPKTFMGKPIEGAMDRVLNKSSEEPSEPVTAPPVVQPAGESFILTYDTDFSRELIAKSNELFSGTKAEIPAGSSGEVKNMYALKRLGLITAIYKDDHLRSHNLWPITPLQSEELLKEGKLPEPRGYWEDLGLTLFDRSPNGKNPGEAKALYESLKRERDQLGLSEGDLEERMLIINAGLEVDSDMPHGAKPIILPGLTQVYIHPVLFKTGQNYKFEYGLEWGIPSESDLGRGNRTLHMPSRDEDIGLRVLYRDWYLDLYAWGEDLVDSVSDGRVNFAR